jgi:PEP-CTERM motif
MRTLFLSAAVLLFAGSGFAGTVYNNFTGYNPYWNPLGYPNTATYGETFTAPTNGDTNLQSFGFYMAGPVTSGDMIVSAYIATWTGSNAGTLLFTSPSLDYANTGNAELTFSTGGLSLTGGANYIAFLSVSEYYGQSSGQSYISVGDSTIPGGGFAYYNNGGSFSDLFSNGWDAPGLQPDWAITATFGPGSGVPEPGTVILLGAGFLALMAIRRRLNS